MPTGNANKPQLEMRGRDLKAYIYNNNIAFMKDPRICDLQEFNNIQLGYNYCTDKYCKLFADATATEMES